MVVQAQQGPGGAPGRYLVVGDSWSVVGPHGAEPPTSGFLFPNVAGRLLGLRADVVAQDGWTSRDAWRAWPDDPRIRAALADPATTAVLVAVGGVDQLPASLPSWLRHAVPDVGPTWLRRLVRGVSRRLGYRAARLVRGRLRRLSQPATDHSLTQIVRAVRAERPDVAVAALTPPHVTSAVCPPRTHDAAIAGCRAWAAREDVALADIDAVTARMHRADRGHPDGRHLDEQAHREVGAEIARALAEAVAAAAVGYADPMRPTRLLAEPR